MNRKIQGSNWESRFDAECKYHGVDVMKLGSDKWTPSGFKAKKGLPDRLLYFEDQISLIDLKSFKDQISIRYSDIDQNQVEELLKCESHGHRAGYLCYFMKMDAVVFFSANQLSEITHNHSLMGLDGEYIGTFKEFNIGNLFIKAGAFRLV